MISNIYFESEIDDNNNYYYHQFQIQNKYY